MVAHRFLPGDYDLVNPRFSHGTIVCHQSRAGTMAGADDGILVPGDLDRIVWLRPDREVLQLLHASSIFSHSDRDAFCFGASGIPRTETAQSIRVKIDRETLMIIKEKAGQALGLLKEFKIDCW